MCDDCGANGELVSTNACYDWKCCYKSVCKYGCKLICPNNHTIFGYQLGKAPIVPRFAKLTLTL